MEDLFVLANFQKRTIKGFILLKVICYDNWWVSCDGKVTCPDVYEGAL